MNRRFRLQLVGAAVGILVGLVALYIMVAGVYWLAPWQQTLCLVVVVLIVAARIALAAWHPKNL